MRRWNMNDPASVRDVQAHVSSVMDDRMRSLILQQLSYIGEHAVKVARDKTRANTWGDRTGNLRSSIGYVIIDNGKVVTWGKSETFTGPEGNGSEGESTARSVLDRLASSHSEGIVLIITAGMDYAEYVEFRYQKDVLYTSWKEAERLAEKLIKPLFKK